MDHIHSPFFLENFTGNGLVSDGIKHLDKDFWRGSYEKI
jgi:hypothetical protein